MKDLTTISTNEVVYNEMATKKVLLWEEFDLQDPAYLSIFDAKFGNDTFSITACWPIEYNLIFKENWQHILVRPNFEATPSYEVMSKIASTFFNKDELCMQVIPKRCNYVSNEPYTLHLWNMVSRCNFQIDEAIYQTRLETNCKNGVFVRFDSLGNRYIAIVTNGYWPSWLELVHIKEEFFGTNVDAVIINRGFEKDVQIFSGSRKIVLIWEATDVDLPDKLLV